jgi:hypothetical protein
MTWYFQKFTAEKDNCAQCEICGAEKEHASKALSLTGLQYETLSWLYEHQNYTHTAKREVLTAVLIMTVFWGCYLVTLKMKGKHR